MAKAKWTGNIATTSGSLKTGGADGGGRVTFDIPEDAMADVWDLLRQMRWSAVRITIEDDDMPTFGRRADD